MKRIVYWIAVFILSILSPLAQSGDVVSVKKLGPELAHDLVQAALLACREAGYQVSAVAVDRDGSPVAVLRDSHASRFTLQIAEEKANAVVLSGVASGVFRDNRRDIQQEMNHVRGILVLQGGLPIRAAGVLLGAIGVSGAPGGEKDEVCAQQALDAVQDRLDFVE